LLSVPFVNFWRLIAGRLPKWLSGLVSLTGGPAPGGGVPAVLPMFVYWPGVAIRLAVKVHVSVVSSKPLPFVSPPTKVALKSSAPFPGVPLSS
jgi:hypothetical protein